MSALKINTVLYSALLMLFSGCVYRPLVSWEDLSFDFSDDSQGQSQKVEIVDDTPRGRFFMPTINRPMLPGPSLEINDEVRAELRHFLKGDQRFIKEALKRRAKYYSTLLDVFKDEGIPPELINLALIESGYRTNARSHVGAVGMWQFMKGTARAYGLRVSLFEDQRKDVILSTIAAARLLKDLYYQFKDWNLALAAYNAGPNLVKRAIKRTGTKNFWVISKRGRLPRQTRRFVPRFIAATLLVKRHEQKKSVH